MRMYDYRTTEDHLKMDEEFMNLLDEMTPREEQQLYEYAKHLMETKRTEEKVLQGKTICDILIPQYQRIAADHMAVMEIEEDENNNGFAIILKFDSSLDVDKKHHLDVWKLAFFLCSSFDVEAENDEQFLFRFGFGEEREDEEE